MNPSKLDQMTRISVDTSPADTPLPVSATHSYYPPPSNLMAPINSHVMGVGTKKSIYMDSFRRYLPELLHRFSSLCSSLLHSLRCSTVASRANNIEMMRGTDGISAAATAGRWKVILRKRRISRYLSAGEGTRESPLDVKDDNDGASTDII